MERECLGVAVGATVGVDIDVTSLCAGDIVATLQLLRRLCHTLFPFAARKAGHIKDNAAVCECVRVCECARASRFIYKSGHAPSIGQPTYAPISFIFGTFLFKALALFIIWHLWPP